MLTLIDTAGCGMEEAADEDSDSKRNEGEARVTIAHAQRLVSGGVRPEDIGIITPYNAQVEGTKGTLAFASPDLILQHAQ